MTPAPETASVLLLPGLPADDSRSMRRYAEELYAALRECPKAGPTVEMEHPPDHRYFSRLIDGRQARRLDRAWDRWVSYPRSLRRRRAGLFHILDQGYAHLLRALDPERTIITCHDLIPLLAAEGAIAGRLSARATRIFRLKVRYLTRARKIIVDSSVTKDTLERYTSMDPRRVEVVPLGVTPRFRCLPAARSSRRSAAGLGQTARVVLQVATGGAYKNTPALLRALAQLPTRIPEVVLVRIGAPLSRDEADLARRLAIADRVHYVRGVDGDDVLAEWYNAADVLVFPSVWEGFGWPPLEAMACGTPVVASAIPAVSEVVGDAGLLVPPDDPSLIAAATERVLTDAALAARLREQGLQQAARFTWAATAARTAAVYAELLEDGKIGVGAVNDARRR